jgi:hypothetical protein
LIEVLVKAANSEAELEESVYAVVAVATATAQNLPKDFFESVLHFYIGIGMADEDFKFRSCNTSALEGTVYQQQYNYVALARRRGLAVSYPPATYEIELSREIEHQLFLPEIPQK